MSLNSITFLLFFAAVYAVLMFIKNISVRKIVLLAASFVFYAYSSLMFAAMLAVYIVLIYALSRKNTALSLKSGVVVSALMLGLFKYYGFFVSSFNLSGPSIKMIIPLGISFYCFRGISYLVDIYRHKYEADSDLVSFALYIAYFPEIISGPISRYKDMKPQFEKNEQNVENLITGSQMFLIGLVKKVVLADNLALFVNAVYDRPEIYSSLTIVLAVLAYSMEIYLDFSGYSDMSIGVSKMLGFDIRKNFDMPYISRNVTEFWKRWHISLSSWLQEYVYYSLGGNRKGKIVQYINLFLTMAIGGLWHGASWTFVAWGSLQGLALIVHKIYMTINKSSKNSDYTWNVLLTFIFITLSWIPFRASSFSQMLAIIEGIFAFRSGVSFVSSWSIISLVIVFISYVYVFVKEKKNGQSVISSYYPVQDLTTIKGLIVFFALIACVLCFGFTGGSPFIYAAF